MIDANLSRIGRKAKNLEERTKDLEENIKRVRKICVPKEERYTVRGIDKFSNEDWIHKTYATAREAIGEARRMTTEAKPYASDSSVATVYYAYGPDGRYLGGDSWRGE